MAIRISKLVSSAIDAGQPVLALETGIVTHALPRPLNLETALQAEETLRANDVVPATIGVLEGDIVIGLSADEITELANDAAAKRVSIRDLAVVATKGLSGGVALAATAHLAHRVGIKVCASTGLGGVHRIGLPSYQESSDLSALASHPVVVVTAGVRPMLDVAATLERLETLSIPVLGYQTIQFPGFFTVSSGYELDHRVDDPAEIAKIAQARDEMGLQQAILIANPVPADVAFTDERFAQLMSRVHDLSVEFADEDEDAVREAIEHYAQFSQGDAWRINVELYKNNARLGGEIATKLASRLHYTD